MVTTLEIFSGFSVNDIDAARTFYRDALGLDVTDGPMGNLDIALPAGSHVFVYPKPDHQPEAEPQHQADGEDVQRADGAHQQRVGIGQDRGEVPTVPHQCTVDSPLTASRRSI